MSSLSRPGLPDGRQVRDGGRVAAAAYYPVPNTDFSRALLTSALGHLGEVDAARQVWGELMAINPNYSFAGHIGRQPFKRKEDVDRIAEGLNKAGVRVC